MRNPFPFEGGKPAAVAGCALPMTEKEFVMTLLSISLSQLVPSKANPRKLFDVSTIEGLAASIRADGLLQNLVVAPANGKGKRYTIISGERRYRALKLLEERGELPDGFTIPVEVRSRLTKEESLRLSTVENLQRADLTPLEQTAALTKLVKDGERLDDVAAQTGLSATTIKRRLALNGLCKEAKQALEAKILSLAQAEALTLGTDEDQKRFVEEIGRGQFHSPDWIKSRLIGKRPCVSDAIFPLERYTGTLTTDLFADDAASFFDDAEQFLSLQKEAAEELAEHHRATAAWVDVTEDWHIRHWHYEEAPEGEPGGVLINVSPRGEVEIIEGLIKTKLDDDTAEAIAENPIAPPKRKASHSTSLRRMLACHKSMAVQEMLLSATRRAKELAAVRSFVELEQHTSIGMLAKEEDPQGAYRVLDAQAKHFAAKLGLVPEQGEDIWSVFPPDRPDDVAVYRSVKAFSDHELEAFQILVTALSFGQGNCDKFDTGESLFNVIARDLKVSMRNHWRPDRSFFEKRTRDQLVSVAKECGFGDGRSSLSSYKKSELVSGLAKFFAEAQSAADPTPAQRKALDWLPQVMLFPAVDPDAGDAAEDMDADPGEDGLADEHEFSEAA